MIQVIHSTPELTTQTTKWRTEGLKIGFVPTMGNLHEGHLSLVQKAAELSDRVVVSIFVNPLQFDEQVDLDAYPRTLQADLRALEALSPAVVFAPDEPSLYPRGRESVTRVEVPVLSNMLEGAARPGHFAGVATVVAKFFNCVQPDLAVFGEKDFQQLLLIRRMVADLNIPVQIVGMPTLREADGLALSSRNSRLNDKERRTAPRLYQALQAVRDEILAGNRDFESLEKSALKQLGEHGFSPDYVAIRAAETLLTPAADEQSLVILAAARLGRTRLIDNLRV